MIIKINEILIYTIAEGVQANYQYVNMTHLFFFLIMDAYNNSLKSFLKIPWIIDLSGFPDSDLGHAKMCQVSTFLENKNLSM